MNPIRRIFPVARQFDQRNREEGDIYTCSLLMIGCLLILFVNAAHPQLKSLGSKNRYYLPIRNTCWVTRSVSQMVCWIISIIRFLLLDDGTTRFYIISSDVCLYSPSEYDRWRLCCKTLWNRSPECMVECRIRIRRRSWRVWVIRRVYEQPDTA